jgi:chromosome segregation ATPase
MSREVSLVGLGLSYIEDVLSALNSAAHRLQKSTNDMNNIETLLLHGNRLQSLASSSSLSSTLRLPKLMHLNVSSNELFALDCADLSGSPDLESVDVAANRIKSVRNLALLPRLSTLNLSYNMIDSLSFLEDTRGDSFASLTSLDLRDNSITRLSELLALRNAPKLVDLKIQTAEIVGIKSSESSNTSSSSSYRVRSSTSNPVCMDPDYISTVLASCPSLEILDGVSVSKWRQVFGRLEKHPNPHLHDSIPLSMHQISTDQSIEPVTNPVTSIDLETHTTQKSTSPESLSTPKLDSAANRFIKRFLTDPEATAAIAAAVVAASSSSLSTNSNQIKPSADDTAINYNKGVKAVDNNLDIQSRFESLEARLALLTSDTQSAMKQESHSALGTSSSLIQSPLRVPPRHSSPGDSREVSTNTSPVRTKVAEISTLFEMKDAASNTEKDEEAHESSSSHTSAIPEDIEKEWVAKVKVAEDALTAALSDVQRLSREVEAAREDNAKESLVIGEYRNRIGDLEAQLVSLPSASAMESLKAKVRDLEVDLEHVTAQYKTARSEATDDNELIKKLKAALSEITAERDSQKYEASRQSTEIDSLKALLASEKELKMRIEEASRLSGEQMAVSVTNAMVRARDAELAINEERKRSEDAHRENVRLASDLAAAKADLENWKARAAEATARGKADVVAERERAMQAISAAEERLSSARAAAEDEVRRVTREANTRLASARTAIDQHAVKQSGVHKTISEMKSEMENVKLKLISSQNEATEANRLSQTLKDALKASEAKYSLLVGETETALKGKVHDHTLALEAVESSLKSAIHDRDELRVEKERLVNEVRVKEVQLTDAMDTIRKLKRELETLKEESHANDAGLEDAIADLKAQLEDVQAAREAEQLEWEEERANSSTANQRASDSEEQAQAARRVAVQLENVVRELRLEAASTEEKLKKQIADKEATLSFVEREVAQLKKAFDDKNAALMSERDQALAAAEEVRRALQKAEEENKILEQSCKESVAAVEAAAAEAAVNAKAASDAQIDHARKRVAAVEAEMRVVLRELDAARAQGAEQSKKLKDWLGMIPSALAANVSARQD